MKGIKREKRIRAVYSSCIVGLNWKVGRRVLFLFFCFSPEFTALGVRVPKRALKRTMEFLESGTSAYQPVSSNKRLFLFVFHEKYESSVLRTLVSEVS